jgi:hypothetical protein
LEYVGKGNERIEESKCYKNILEERKKDTNLGSQFSNLSNGNLSGSPIALLQKVVIPVP